MGRSGWVSLGCSMLALLGCAKSVSDPDFVPDADAGVKVLSSAVSFKPDWRNPKVHISGAVASGGNLRNASNATSLMRGALTACYRQALVEHPLAYGWMLVQIEVGTSGAVESVMSKPSGELPTTLLGCVAAQARSVVFDAPEGAPALITFHLVFNREPAPLPKPLGPMRSQAN